jgi:AcrR family transcriptional regulator
MKKPLRSQPTRDRILDAARRLFGQQGYELTTIRGVADAADIHPSLVMRYYGNKEGLFAAAAVFDLEFPDLIQVKRGERGPVMVRHFLDRWEARDHELPALLRVAVTHDQARARLIEIFRRQLMPVVASLCGAERAPECTALIATQMLGLALTRYVLRLPPVVALKEELIVERVGATVEAYLSGGEGRGSVSPRATRRQR